MKVNEIITESSSTILQLDEYRKLLESEYSDAYRQALKGNLIYRGFGDMTITFMHLEPMRGRKSVNTNNVYTAIMNEHPKFQSLPKRSVIATTSRNVAMVYSASDDNLAVLFPKNGTKIAMVPANDIWNVVPEEFKGTRVGFFSIGNMIERWALKLGVDHIDTLEELRHLQDVFEKEKKNDSEIYQDSQSKLRYELELFASKKIVEEILNDGPKRLYEMIDPDLFKVFDISNLPDLQAGNNELWFDDEYLAVSVSLLDIILDR